MFNLYLRKILDKFGVIRRGLHIVSFLQRGRDDGWNYKKFLKLLEEEERILFPDKKEKGLSESVVKTSIKQMKKLFDIDIPVKAGCHYIDRPGIPLEVETFLIKLYFMFIGNSYQLDRNIKAIRDTHNGEILYLFAELYFAILRKKVIEIEYSTSYYFSSEQNIKIHIVHPYYIVLHRNSFYLLGLSVKHNNISHYTLFGIRKIRELDENFTEDIPPLKKLYRYSLDAFIGDEVYDVVLYVNNFCAGKVASIVSYLNPEIKRRKEGVFFYFKISDYITLCKELFPYSECVRIIKPKKLKEYMVNMAKVLLDEYS